MVELRRVRRVPLSPQEKRDCWSAIPGVTFPEPETEVEKVRAECWGQEELPDPAAWVDTPAAAQVLHLSASAVRFKFRKLGVPSLLARGRRYWCRREVAALAGERVVLAEPPAGWLLVEEALARLGCSRSSLDGYSQKGRMRCREALVGGKRRNLYNAEDVECLAALLRTERETAAALREWR